MALDPKYKAFVFDMDGTFIDTKVDYEALANVVFDAMVAHGVPEEVIDRSGGSKFELDSGAKWMIAHGKERELYGIKDEISGRCTEIEMENAAQSRPFKGASELLDLLHERGYKTGILTRGGHSYATYLFNMHGVLDKIDAVLARDDIPEEETKPSPIAMHHIAKALGVKADEIVYFGDHKFDYYCARDSGAKFYGVLSGNYSIDDWKALGEPIDLINSVADAAKFL